jgi:DNA-binding NarL/FixJ family response regulator
VRLRGEPPSRPTPRQLELLRALYRCGSAKEAGLTLGITRQTVKYHLADLYRRLGVSGAYEAAYALWLRDQWGDSGWGPRGADL